MNKTTAALKLAEEALEGWKEYDTWTDQQMWNDDDEEALAAIRTCLEQVSEVSQETEAEALAEQEKQEPVAWGCMIDEELVDFVPTEQKDINGNKGNYETPLYAAPVSAKREWVELTDDDINKCVYATFEDCPTSAERKLVSAVIAAFKEKNK